MIELANSHLSTNVFTHGYKCDTDCSERLESVVLPAPFLLLDVVATVVHHFLHLQHVRRPRPRADLYENLCLLRNVMVDSFQRLDCRI